VGSEKERQLLQVGTSLQITGGTATMTEWGWSMPVETIEIPSATIVASG
jgi:hypothetical protein